MGIEEDALFADIDQGELVAVLQGGVQVRRGNVEAHGLFRGMFRGMSQAPRASMMSCWAGKLRQLWSSAR